MNRGLEWLVTSWRAEGATWGTVKEYIGESTKAIPNDGTVLRVIRSLEKSFIAQHEAGTYRLVDPMIRAFVLEARGPPRVARGPRRSASRPAPSRGPRHHV